VVAAGRAGRGRRLGVGAVTQQRGGDGADGQGGHDQDGVAGDGGVEAGLALVEAEAVLEVGDTLQDYSRRLPSEVEITNPRHPLAGQRVPVVSGYRWHGRAWLTVTFPDGYPARIPVQDTDLAGAHVAGTGGTVLSVPGIRRLRDLVRGRTAPAADGAAPCAGALPGRDGRRGAVEGTHIGSPAGTAANESRR
jgi:hypothetical protein